MESETTIYRYKNSNCKCPKGENSSFEKTCVVTYRFGFNGKIKDDEITGVTGANLDFGAREYDSRIGRWWSVEPLYMKYPFFSPYCYVANNPILNIDGDGRDIIVLCDKDGAHSQGHQAVLIGNSKDGWTYISKDGYKGSSAFEASEPIFTVQKFSSINEFANSANNFVLEKGHHNSDEDANQSFKLDGNGNKIQRYDNAFYIETDPNTDKQMIDAAVGEAKKDYKLMEHDCSDVPTQALNVGKTKSGEYLKNGESEKADGAGWLGNLWKERPRTKQSNIEERNNGTHIDKLITPSSTELKSNEKGSN